MLNSLKTETNGDLAKRLGVNIKVRVGKGVVSHPRLNKSSVFVEVGYNLDCVDLDYEFDCTEYGSDNDEMLDALLWGESAEDAVVNYCNICDIDILDIIWQPVFCERIKSEKSTLKNFSINSFDSVDSMFVGFIYELKSCVAKEFEVEGVSCSITTEITKRMQLELQELADYENENLCELVALNSLKEVMASRHISCDVVDMSYAVSEILNEVESDQNTRDKAFGDLC